MSKEYDPGMARAGPRPGIPRGAAPVRLTAALSPFCRTSSIPLQYSSDTGISQRRGMVPVHGQGKTSDMRKDGSDFAQTREIGQNTWMGRMAQIGSDHGLFDRIGENHLTLFVDEGDTLIVAFDRAERARDIAADGLPAGFEMVRRRSWSLLSIMAEGDTWFLDAALTRFFRTLHSRGLFRGFRG
jgi:hypothetical protein